MSSTSATQSNQYDLVSSFYGPGAVVGWYLTALACLTSFSLHPHKRCRDSITADLIAVVTFPTVAAADLITQVRSYPKEGISWAQNAASFEASLIVMETFFTIDLVLFLLAEIFGCMRRARLLGTVGLFCFSAESYAYFSPSKRPAIGQNLDRLFLFNLNDLLVHVIFILLVGIIIALRLIAISYLTLPHQRHARLSERAVEAMRKVWEGYVRRSNDSLALMFITCFYLPCFIVISLLQLFLPPFINSPSQFWPWIRTAASRIAHGLIPRSDTSIKELDQVVAILAGATVLGFSLYSTADTYYQAWLSNTRAITQQRGTELRTLSHNQAPSH